MKPYAKLCGYLFDWLSKPLRRVILGLFAVDLLIAVCQLRYCARFDEFLNSTAVLGTAIGALAIFLLLAQNHFHQFFNGSGSHGIYTLCTLPAPGWALPAAVYTVYAVCILALAAAQLVSAAIACAFYFGLYHPGGNLYLAVMRSDLFRYLLPHTLLDALKTLKCFELAVLFPFAFLPGRPAFLFQPTQPPHERIGIFLAALLMAWVFSLFSLPDQQTLALLKNAAACLIFAACDVWELYCWSHRPNRFDRCPSYNA